MSDVYDDVELPYPDAKVAQILATGGPCYYLLPEEMHLTNTAGGGGGTTMLQRPDPLP